MAFKKGYKPWNKGIKYTADQKKKMDFSGLEKGQGLFRGKKFSKEYREKLSIGRTGKMTGENHPKWKGGRSQYYKTGYYSKEYKEWRLKIFVRDNFQCQGCKNIGGYLTAHHIKSFTHYPELRYNLDNGVTLCEDCHKLTDNYKGRANTK